MSKAENICSASKRFWASREVFTPLLFTFFLGGAISAFADLNIVWSDEFNGTSINTNVWYVQDGNCNGWGFNELQYYTANNVVVSNGLLHIIVLNQTTNGSYFTSGRINSAQWNDCTSSDLVPVEANSYAVQYGLIEYRIKLPLGTGFWPQIWLYPQNSPYLTWPNCGEIDVFENDNGSRPNSVQGAIHYNGGDFYAYCPVNDISQWHTYAVQWTPNSISWLVDGTILNTCTNWNPPPGYSFPAPFNWPFFFEINLAVGGAYVGNPTPGMITNTPAEMDVDYVRVYQQTAPLAISIINTNLNIVLSWPTNIVCHLQSLTNTASIGSPAGWFDVGGATNPFVVSAGAGNSFFRLESP